MINKGMRKVSVAVFMSLAFVVVVGALCWQAISHGSDLQGFASVVEKIALGLAGVMGFFSWGNRAEHTK